MCLCLSQADQLDAVHWMLTQAIPPDTQLKGNRQTALHIACLKGHFHCVQSLLMANADIFLMDEQKCNAFAKAERGKKKDLIIPLLKSKGQSLSHLRHT